MHNARTVSLGQPLADLCGDVDHVINRQRSALDPLLERLPGVVRLLPRHRTQAGAGGHTSGNRVAIIIGVCPGL